MAKVTYITPSGEEVVVEDAIGNLMEIAREHDVEGIEGACSGCCSCPDQLRGSQLAVCWILLKSAGFCWILLDSAALASLCSPCSA